MDVTNIRRVSLEILVESGLFTDEQIRTIIQTGTDDIDQTIIEGLRHIPEDQLEFILARLRKEWVKKFVQ